MSVESTEAKPKPCPFCRRRFLDVMYVMNMNTQGFFVACRNCHAGGPIAKVDAMRGEAVRKKAKAKAVERWNRAKR